MPHRVFLSVRVKRTGSIADQLWVAGLYVLSVFCAAGQMACCQDAAVKSPLRMDSGTAVVPVVATRVPARSPVEQEVTVESMVSYGDFKIFGAAERCNVWTSGVEYDRNLLGHHFGAQIDYVVEVLPFALLSQPVTADYWGNPTSPYQELVPGLGISPIGFRLLWRSKRAIKPYLVAKGGAIAFSKKALSPYATYLNYNWQGEIGVEFPLTDRVELRVGPIEHYHVSNGHMSGSNPGVDELAAKIGVSYHLGRRRGE